MAEGAFGFSVGVHVIPLHRTSFGIQAAEVKPVGFSPEDIALLIHSQAVRIGCWNRQNEVLEFGGTRIDPADTVGCTAIGIPDIAVAVEMRFLGSPTPAERSCRKRVVSSGRVQRYVILNVNCA